MALHLKSRIQDLVMRSLDEHRREALGPAEGRVLEIGFGTGRNLVHYSDGVRSLTGVDPLKELHPGVEARIAEATFPVEHLGLRADGGLPLEDDSFDCVVTTWTLCSIPQAVDALREMRRVLRPGGRYLFIEHGLSDHEKTARWQDRLNPAWRRFSGGCNMNRPIAELVSEGGFVVKDMEHFLGKGPRVLGELYRGMATG